MNTVAIVQARMSSTRLPGKTLMTIGERPLLWHVVRRARGAGVADEVIVATSDRPSDDPIETFGRDNDVPVFRGDLDDVLDRFHAAAVAHDAERVIRLTADCPLLDAGVVAGVARAFDPVLHDYVSNTIERTYPDGLDTEVFSGAALECAWTEARLPSEREHVTPFLWKNDDRFRIGQVRQETDLSAMRWTVDEPRDLEFVRAVYDAVGREDFGQAEVVEALERDPALARINEGIPMNEGYEKSLRADAASEANGA